MLTKTIYRGIRRTGESPPERSCLTGARRLLFLWLCCCLSCVVTPLTAQENEQATYEWTSNSTISIDEDGNVIFKEKEPEKTAGVKVESTTSTIDLPQDNQSIEARGIDQQTIDALRDKPEYQYNVVKPEEPSLWDELWYWLVRNLFSPIDDEGQVTPFKLISYGLILLALVLLVRVLMGGAFFGLLGRRDKSTGIDYTTGAEEDIHSMSLEDLLSEALAQENYRSAVRYRFLMLLRELARQNKISWRREKTNSRYMAEIQDPELKQMFRKAAWWFDLAWYGEWSLTAADEAQIAQVFRECMARLGVREAMQK